MDIVDAIKYWEKLMKGLLGNSESGKICYYFNYIHQNMAKKLMPS